MGEIKALSDSPSIRLEGLPPWLGDGVRHALKNPELTLYKIKHSASKFSVVLVPLAVPFLWLMFAGRRGVFLYDHVVFCLHSLSFMAVLVSALSLLGGAGVPPLPLVWALALIPPVHIFMHLRDAYGLSLGGAVWRSVALLIVAQISLIFYGILIISLGLVE